jgi:hypothetical protein
MRHILTSPKPLVWIGSSKKDLKALPDDVIDVFGYALHLAQAGDRHNQAKPLQGFGSAGVLACWKSWKTIAAIPIVRFTPFDSPNESMYCMCFRRNQNPALLRPSRIWI